MDQLLLCDSLVRGCGLAGCRSAADGEQVTPNAVHERGERLRRRDGRLPFGRGLDAVGQEANGRIGCRSEGSVYPSSTASADSRRIPNDTLREGGGGASPLRSLCIARPYPSFPRTRNSAGRMPRRRRTTIFPRHNRVLLYATGQAPGTTGAGRNLTEWRSRLPPSRRVDVAEKVSMPRSRSSWWRANTRSRHTWRMVSIDPGRRYLNASQAEPERHHRLKRGQRQPARLVASAGEISPVAPRLPKGRASRRGSCAGRRIDQLGRYSPLGADHRHRPLRLSNLAPHGRTGFEIEERQPRSRLSKFQPPGSAPKALSPVHARMSLTPTFWPDATVWGEGCREGRASGGGIHLNLSRPLGTLWESNPSLRRLREGGGSGGGIHLNLSPSGGD